MKVIWGSVTFSICYQMIALCYLLSVTCYMLLAIWIFLSKTCYYLQELVPFARCSTSRNFLNQNHFTKKSLHRIHLIPKIVGPKICIDPKKIYVGKLLDPIFWPKVVDVKIILKQVLTKNFCWLISLGQQPFGPNFFWPYFSDPNFFFDPIFFLTENYFGPLYPDPNFVKSF